MRIERSGAGDPARTVALLWRRTATISRHGPRPALSIDAVVDAAIGLADAEGLAAVTMRRVAAALGVVPMTLYTYVPSKAELLDVMLDTLYSRMTRADTTGQPWRRRLTVIANENLAMLAAHPWAAGVSTVRPPLGPGLMAKYEHELSALEGLGLDDVEMDAALTYLLGFVQGCARAAADTRAVARDSAMADAQWWEQTAPLLADVVDDRAYPIASRVGAAAGARHGGPYSPDHAYEFGLGRLLDGLAALIDHRA
ncbi:MAG: TetR/AcrR family transcriptional regulator [Chloroflexi bacterium]|nr:MAG: TetR/AcrR family transcriptional regulator [Chloroflexota bacterium]